MMERWNLFLDRTTRSVPCPWGGKPLAEVSAADLEALPGTADFLRYSPTDGPIDRVHVPGSLPREVPVCRTRLAFCHDEANLMVAIIAHRPADPIPELADCPNEDFAVVIPSRCAGRGFYFGLNQAGESIGCTQIWDNDIPVDEADAGAFEGIPIEGVAGPSGWRSGLLDGLYEARVIAVPGGLAACFRIRRALIGRGMEGNRLRLSAGRVCYATGEWVSWGSPILWSARQDLHGTVQIVDAARPASLPALSRLDLLYDPETEHAEWESRWEGVSGPGFGALQAGPYKGYADKVTVALNGREVTVPLAGTTRVAFPLPDGWNRLEVMAAAQPVLELSVGKVSGTCITPLSDVGAAMPVRGELEAAFWRWHEAHEKTYLGGGAWGAPIKGRHCLCHAGMFHLEPYLVAGPILGRRDVFDQRIRETCARMLAEQMPEGWFPCYCSANRREPERGDGGAFTNGSVGEGLVLASQWLGEKTWLDSAVRAADYAWYRWENNQNYAAFALWHLAALQQVDPQARWLDQALYLARHFVTRDIGPGGTQGGHNYFTAYGSITLKGMARLLAVMPEGHEFRARLKDKVVRYANQILSRQQPGGLFAGRNRKYLGYHHPVPGLFCVAGAIPDQAARLEPALAAMTRAIVRGGQEDPQRQVDSDSGLVLALALSYLDHRDGASARAGTGGENG